MTTAERRIRAILGLCSREYGHPVMYEMLSRALLDFHQHRGAWDTLVLAAEQHGVAPLLYKHLLEIAFDLPKDQQRTLRSLYQRNRFSARVRNRAIEEILSCCRQEQIESIPVKGIALANHVYDKAEFRPMRDIDILVDKQQLQRAEQLLIKLGYRRAKDHDIPEDYYHLPPLQQTIDGLPVAIELHHDLLPLEESYPRWPLAKSLATLLPFRIGSSTAATLNMEDSLYYLYLHGFRAPLSYEEFRFIHLADIVTLVERYFDRIDWQEAGRQFKHLLPVLSRFHFITPWRDEIVDSLNLDIDTVPKQSGRPFRGWPLYKMENRPIAGIGSLLYETLLPPQWWMQVYYGQLGGAAYWKSRCFEHPRAIWRWLKASYRSGNKQ